SGVFTFPQISAADPFLSGQSDPTSGGTFLISEAQAKALGLIGGNVERAGKTGGYDGYVGFGNLSKWNYASSPAVSGTVDLVGAAEHEFSEIMGRYAQLTPGSDYSVLDMFRYAAPGVRNLTSAPTSGYTSAYFSLDNG